MEFDQIGFGRSPRYVSGRARFWGPWVRLGTLGAPGGASGKPGDVAWEVLGQPGQLIFFAFGYLY